MRLIIDGYSVPGVIVNFSHSLAKQFNIDSKSIRERESDLYKITSGDFDKEIKKLTSFSYLKEILDQMNSNDILITDDLELAKHALPRIATIIGSDGLVYTQERLDILSIQEHINKLQGKSTAKKLLKNRDESLDEQFKQTLYEYLNNI